MRCSDGNYYVVKFQNNPQHKRVLVNELLGTRLAEKLGLPTTPCAIVRVSNTIIDQTPDLVMELPRYRLPCSPGMQFGSRYFGNPKDGRTLQIIPPYELPYVSNASAFVGMVVFDKWVCNTDARQLLFKRGHTGLYAMVAIDQGFCCNQGEWNFPDAPMWGFCWNKSVYRSVKSIEDFEPWLSRLEAFNMDTLLEAADGIPSEWYEHDSKALTRLLEQLDLRRKKIRQLLIEWGPKLPLIFPMWETRKMMVAVCL
jgi:hypothetical protein